MHWAAHKHTAAEVIYQRADAEKENMGLTSWSGDTIHRSDVCLLYTSYTDHRMPSCHPLYAYHMKPLWYHRL